MIEANAKGIVAIAQAVRNKERGAETRKIRIESTAQKIRRKRSTKRNINPHQIQNHDCVCVCLVLNIFRK